MTDKKICPFMSRPYISCISGKDECGTRTQYTDVEYVECQKDRCMAWVPEHVEHIPGDDRYFGREARTIKYPARCALIKTAGWGVEDE